MNIRQHRTREARQITTVIALVCAVGFTAAIVPALEHGHHHHPVTGAGLALPVLVGRIVARVVRERWEDRADTRTAAAWRARHAPHLLTTAARDRGAV